MKEYKQKIEKEIIIFECEVCGKQSQNWYEIAHCEETHKQENCKHKNCFYYPQFKIINNEYCLEIDKSCEHCNLDVGNIVIELSQEYLKKIYESNNG